jgi:hypothetical protein
VIVKYETVAVEEETTPNTLRALAVRAFLLGVFAQDLWAAI